MRYRLFGRSGLRVSEFILGAMIFGPDAGPSARLADPESSRRIFDAFAAAGGNTIDTANRYTDGHSERLVGEFVASERDRFVLSTKYTLTIDESDPNASGNHRKSLTRSLEQSLRRLRTDYIDIFWVHIWDADTPIEETVRALDDAVTAGKVLYVGISDAPAWVVARANTIAELRGWTPFVGLQVPYSLVNRQIERELLPVASAFGMSITAWSPLGSGLLSGKYVEGSEGSGRLDARTIPERDRAIARETQAVAEELGVTSPQVALAWLRAQSALIHPIVGARRVEQLIDNLGAADVELTDEALARLDAVSALEPAFPTDMINDTRGFVYGAAGELVVHR
ncbi:MAG: aldo/keto reductase [Actinomycetota bacterium]|nr:aldo/keto reductase [Actinomycetota bacterium]